MEGLKVDGRMKVKTLRADFKKTFGFALRVYNTQNHYVDDELLLANVRQTEDASKSGDFTIDPEWTVDEFEKNFKDTFGIKVQVYTTDDTQLADNNLKISSGKSLKVDGRMKVKTLRENFKNTYNFCLRVYNTQNHYVDDELLLSNVRQNQDADKSGDITIDPNWTIDEFEKKFMETYGIKVQVYTPDDTKLANNDIKLFWGE
jgi:L-2-hydroxyglutarate oxidase LhgO